MTPDPLRRLLAAEVEEKLVDYAAGMQRQLTPPAPSRGGKADPKAPQGGGA